MQNLTLSRALFLSRTCVVTLLFAIGCIIVPLCEAATPAASSPSPSKKVTTKTTGNPLLAESTLPYQLPPFDKIKDEHFQPALEQGIVEEEKEAEAIAKQTEKPTFENTIVALEKIGTAPRSRPPDLFRFHRGQHQPHSSENREGNGPEVCRAHWMRFV